MITSPNFYFLSQHSELLARYGADAEKYVLSDPNVALIKLRQFAETLAKDIAVILDIPVERSSFNEIKNKLEKHGILNSKIRQLFDCLRKTGNEAVHNHFDCQNMAFFQLKIAHLLGVWFHRVFSRDGNFQSVFVPPSIVSIAGEVDPDLQKEIELFQQQVNKSQNKPRYNYQDLKGVEDSDKFSQVSLQKVKKILSEDWDDIINRSLEIAKEIELSEYETRKIIDMQLQEAGWKADSVSLHYSKGTRPQKNVNIAIAEWPTKSGFADYVLFCGLTPVAVIEAKKRNLNVAGALQQAKRYSSDYQCKKVEEMCEPYGEYQIPFAFSSNGRNYFSHIKEESGIWFQDLRSPKNTPRVLAGWYTPEGIQHLLKQDLPTSFAKLQREPFDYLMLREYQNNAIRAVEKALQKGKRTILVSMATGTGKTRTCIGLVYRVIKSQLFRRVLFLVDRSALGEQTANAFKEMRLESLQSFTSIYDVKEMGEQLESNTRLHISTIQSIIRRLDNAENRLMIDDYDCIIVDECHRGYNLDREMNEWELDIRDEKDYQSRYRHALEYFDAVKIGLTATPAKHTSEIFGEPVYTYSYREAVIDGYLVDHDPPLSIVTELAEQGISWEIGEQVETYVPGVGETLFNLDDEVNIELEYFNKRVTTENFNQVICAELASRISLQHPGKTLIFCVNDRHADQVTRLLKEQYQDADDKAIMKITGTTDNYLQWIRNFKNERLPQIVTTVDLLTTGIDVPEICNIVFLRRVKSRILYEQMLGRATRLCRKINKESFRIFDAVDLYSALQDFSSMKPVVVNPKITFRQLYDELKNTTGETRQKIYQQFIAKFQRKKNAVQEEFARFTGVAIEDFIKQTLQKNPETAVLWFQDRQNIIELLDKKIARQDIHYISDHEDQVLRVEENYSSQRQCEDYIEAFRKYIQEHRNEHPALIAVTQRPSGLTRKQLKDLELHLDVQGYNEKKLRNAWHNARNEDIAASIIGYIRSLAIGSPLIPYEQRVDQALEKICAQKQWSKEQLLWLERIGKQLKQEIIVDKEDLNRGAFRIHGGFQRINKIFEGALEKVLEDIREQVWTVGETA